MVTYMDREATQENVNENAQIGWLRRGDAKIMIISSVTNGEKVQKNVGLLKE